MKKRLPLLLTLILCWAAVFADNIGLRRENNPDENKEQRDRSATPEVTASIDGSTITLDLTVLAGVEYYVTDETTGTEICYGRFPAGATTEFDLPANTPSGTYRLEVYAYGCFWTGTFIK